jgi:DNA-binding transcriptional ArsR family regulator
MREPSADALTAARNVERRLRGRTSAPVRRQFIERSADGRPAPLATALRGGRGGTVRVKLELTFLWFAAKPPHDLAYPARAWATLLGLPDPAGRGARRINEAILWLEQHKLITVENRAGQPNVVTLLSENGTGAPYELPGTAYNRLRSKKPASLADEHRYIQLPNELWTNGWLSLLSGAAIAMLLVLYTELGNRPAATTDLWFSPSQADHRFGLSEDTRSKGLRELRAAGLITARRQSVATDTFDFQRLRNVYHLEPQRLQQPASLPEEIKLQAPPVPLSTRIAADPANFPDLLSG